MKRIALSDPSRHSVVHSPTIVEELGPHFLYRNRRSRKTYSLKTYSLSKPGPLPLSIRLLYDTSKPRLLSLSGDDLSEFLACLQGSRALSVTLLQNFDR